MDFYVEYYNLIDNLFINFVHRYHNQDSKQIQFREHSIEEAIIHCLYMHSVYTNWKEHYNLSRLSGSTKEELTEKFTQELIEKFGVESALLESSETVKEIPALEEMLKAYSGQITFFVFNERQLHLVAKLIRAIQEPVFILADFEEFDNEIEFAENVTFFRVPFFRIKAFDNPYIDLKFPQVSHYLNSFYFLTKYLNPKKIVFLEGCHLPSKCLNIISKSFSIPTICLQQGWPSFFHTLYRRMNYDYYFTWGNVFNQWWKKYNPNQRYKSVGYTSQILESADKDKVTFFLQSPVFLSDNTYFNQFISLIEKTAIAFPNKIIQIREHPEYKLKQSSVNAFARYKNIIFVNKKQISEVYQETLVTVSHYSTTSIEGVLHGCIPLVFDPTTNSKYYPDIDALGIGFCVNAETIFIEKLNAIFTDKEILKKIKANLLKQKESFLTTSDTNAIKNIIQSLVN